MTSICWASIPKELDDLLDPGTEDRENAVPPVPANPVSKLGDLWLLGKHRVLCGDATDKEWSTGCWMAASRA